MLLPHLEFFFFLKKKETRIFFWVTEDRFSFVQVQFSITNRLTDLSLSPKTSGCLIIWGGFF